MAEEQRPNNQAGGVGPGGGLSSRDETSVSVSDGSSSAGAPAASGPRAERAIIDEAMAMMEAVESGRRAGSGGSGSGDGTEDLPASDAFAGYEVIREVHRGGQGAVYQAIQRATRRRVALKVMHTGVLTGSAGRARFEREVQILGQLNHPNIVRIHDSGKTRDGRFFYVMDYISGRSLDEFISVEPRGSIQDSLELFHKIARAVAAAHLRGVIHRDLKPSNIRVDGNGEPIVVDFGLAKVAVPDVTEESRPQMMTMTGQFIGSLPWASPEQADGAPGSIDVRTDVYSLGVILYQMLTGRFPYEVVGNMRDVLDNILRAEPARPSTIRRQINDEVETIVLKCLAKDRERRYQSAGELARDIERYLHGEPIEAKRDSGWYVMTKTLRRYRAAAGVAASFVALVTVGAVVMTVLYAKAASAESKASTALEDLEDSVKIREEQRAQLDAARESRIEALERGDDAWEHTRELVRLLVTDFHDQIADLRGSTRVRMAVLDAAVRDADLLTQELGNDVASRRLLADIRERIGDLQAGLFLPKLGQGRLGAEQYAMAGEIRRAILAEMPGDARAHADVASSQYREGGILVQLREHAEALAAYDGAVASLDAALSRLPENAAPDDPAGVEAAEWREKWERLRAQAVVLGGDVVATMAAEIFHTDEARATQLWEQAGARYDRASDFWARRVERDTSDTRAARWMGTVSDRRTDLDAAAARQLVRRAENLAKAGDAAGAVAAVEEASARYRRAEDGALAQAERFRKLAAVAPANLSIRRDLYIALHRAGLAQDGIADANKKLIELAGADREEQAAAARRAALAHYLGALEVTEELTRADASNLDARRDLAIVLNKLGNEYRELNMLDLADAMFERSLGIRREVIRSDPMQMHTRDLAVGLFKVAQMKRVRAEAALVPEAVPGGPAPDDEAARRSAETARVFVIEARSGLAESRRQFEVLRDEGVLSANAGEFAELDKEAERIEAAATRAAPKGG